MATERLIFDPDGDLLLRLPYPAEKAEGIEQKEGATSTETLVDDASTDHMEGAMAPEEDLDDLMEETGPSREIHMLVSSRHLMLASPVFRAMLQHSNFKEGDELRKAGSVEVALPDDDYVAFGIMMDIIHGRVSKIPRQVSLDVLANLSILVDKYETLEAFGLIVDVWVPSLAKMLPQSFNKDVLPWLSIAWVFRLPDYFRKMTRILQIAADGSAKEAPSGDLPIPSRVFKEVELRRQRGIRDALDHVERFINNCQSPLGLCTLAQGSKLNVACNGMMLGTFLRSASSCKIWPLPSSPYEGLRVLEVANRIRSMDIKSICDNNFREYTRGYTEYAIDTTKSHGYKSGLATQMAGIESSLSGLEMDWFLPLPSQLKYPEI